MKFSSQGFYFIRKSFEWRQLTCKKTSNLTSFWSMESSITATSPRPAAAAFSRKTATILLKSFNPSSRRNARAAVTHPAAPAWVRPAIRIWWCSSTHQKIQNQRKVPQMTKHDDNFRRFERMAKSAKKNWSGDKPGSCSRCLYYRPDFKAIPHNWTRVICE